MDITDNGLAVPLSSSRRWNDPLRRGGDFAGRLRWLRPWPVAGFEELVAKRLDVGVVTAGDRCADEEGAADGGRARRR